MISRREILHAGCSLLAGGLASGVSSKSFAEQPANDPSHGSVHLNLGGLGASSTFSPFLNYFKTHDVGSTIITRSVGGNLQGSAIWAAGGYLDRSTGDLVTPVPPDVLSISYIWYASPVQHPTSDNSGLAWNIAWDGRGGRVEIELLTPGSRQNINNARGSGSFVFGRNPGNTRLKVTITDRNDPPRNFRIWQQRYNTNWLNGEKFNPDWIAQARKFYRLRLVDWMGSNVTGPLSTNSMATFTDISQFATEGYYSWGAQGVNGSAGPLGLTPLSLLADLANITGCKLHVNIPYMATDQCVADLAAFFKANTKVEIACEYSNEAWNFAYPVTAYCLNQGSAIWPGDGGRYSKWYGYRAAECMKIIREVYNDPTRWSGVLATQTVNPAVTNNILIGIAKWKNSTGSSLNVRDLFGGLYVTGYFGDQQTGQIPSALTNANPAVVTLANHGYKNGQKLRFFCTTGMTQLNNADVTITVIDGNTFSIGIDMTGSSPWIAAGTGNYVIPAVLFEIMDQSSANFIANPALWPTKYTYFNRQLAASLLTGTCAAGFATSINVANLKSTYWPAQKKIADANGLDLNQYEGGNSFVGNYLLQNPGNARFTEYMLASGHSAEIAAVFAANFAGFVAVGGKHPSQYNMAGVSTQFGTWPGMQSVPEAPANPVWQAVLTANGF